MHIGPSVETIGDDAFMTFYESSSWDGSPGVHCTVVLEGDVGTGSFPWTGGMTHESMDIVLD